MAAKLPEKVMGTYPGMGLLERLEADFRRLARRQRKLADGRDPSELMWCYHNAMDTAYIKAAEKVRAARGKVEPAQEREPTGG